MADVVTAVWFVGAVVVFVAIISPAVSMRWLPVSRSALWIRVAVFSAMWPFGLVVLALMEVSPRFRDWINGDG